MKVRIRPSPSNFFHLHAHSHYSWLDGMTTVEMMVDTAHANGQPALALTDHGVMSGLFELYKLCHKAGMAPFPGFEAYFVSDVTNKEAKRYHITMSAFTTEGYKNLIHLCSWSHDRDNYHFKPRIDPAMIKALDMSGIVATTGCWFGFPLQAIEEHAGLTGTGITIMKRRMKMMAKLFPNYYVELQHHDQEHDDYIVKLLYDTAQELGLPVVATQDSHYCELRQKPLHGIMKQLAYG